MGKKGHIVAASRGYKEPAHKVNENGERWCSGYLTGGHFAPIETFGKRARSEDGLHYRCRACEQVVKETDAYKALQRKSQWSRMGIVGMTDELYETMLTEQGGGCYLCGTPPGKTALHVDHDHTTGAPRHLLCVRCNASLERLETLPGWCTKAQAYLNKFRRKEH